VAVRRERAKTIPSSWVRSVQTYFTVLEECAAAFKLRSGAK
jgi:hypothetical protein